ncbi:SURF1 family protein [Arenimonas sp. MALMAid1274]|uniref:SURF1 family protein n=1 Tax=Arenimonas sp. MALMAid1274 TaxID=3411630 RepID=UPI003BA01A58
MKRRIVLTVLALCLAIGFSLLGRWQLGREQQKRDQLAEAAAALSAPPVALSQAIARGQGRAGGIDRVQASGRFLPSPRLLLDNQRRGDRVGVRLYCVFASEAGESLLADLGWLPLPGDRVLPAAPCPSGLQSVSGLLVPPPAVGLRLGPAQVAQDDGERWLATRVEPVELATAWQRPLAGRVLRLDPALPIGHERDLELLSNTLPPEKHRGYAIQWFGLALATLVITLVLNLRRRP